MKSSIQKSLFLLSFLLLMFLIPGCVKNGNDDRTITIFMGIPEENGADSTFVKFLEEKMDINIEIQYLTGDIYTAISKMIIGGTYPDMIYALDATNLVLDAGIALSMEDYLKTGGENIKRIYGIDLDKARTAQGGELKFLPWDRGTSDNITPDGAVYIAKRVLEYYAENHDGEWPIVRTLDQYFSLIEDYLVTHPTVTVKNSKGKEVELNTIGVSFATDVNYDYFFQGAPLRLGGFPNDGNLMVDQETLEVTSVISSEYAYKFLDKLNTAYNKGIIPVDVFSKNDSTYRSELLQGRVLGTLYLQEWYIGEINNEIKRTNPDSMFVPMPVVLEEGIVERYRLAGEMVTRDGLIVTDNCKNPELAFELLNFVCSEEAQIKLHWGTEGVTYSVDENGRFYRTKEQIDYVNDIDNVKKEGMIIRPWPSGKESDRYSNGSCWSPWADPAIIRDSMKPVDLEVLAHYNVGTYSELFNPPVGTLYGQAWDTVMASDSEGAIANENARKRMRVLHPALVKAPNKTEFNKLWDDFVNDPDIANHYKYAEATEVLIKIRAKEWFGIDFD